jgi:hypothetical protein
MTLPPIATRRRLSFFWAGLPLFTIGCHVVLGGFEMDEQGLAEPPPALGTGGQPPSSTGGASGQGPPGEVCEMPGVRRCSDAKLELCVGGQWQEEHVCRTPDHCDVSLGRCLGCVEGESRCAGAKAQQLCDTTTEQWAPQTDCGVGWRCDEDRGQCVKCDPGEGVCQGSGPNPTLLCQCAADRLHFEPVTCATRCVEMGAFDACEGGEGVREGPLQLCERI